MAAKFAVNGPTTFSTNGNLITLSGTAPMTIKTITVNGVAWPLTGTSVNNWTLHLPVLAGTNIDAITFGPQTNNLSMGRYPDGGTTIDFIPTPTPRVPNSNVRPAPFVQITLTGNEITSPSPRRLATPIGWRTKTPWTRRPGLNSNRRRSLPVPSCRCATRWMAEGNASIVWR